MAFKKREYNFFKKLCRGLTAGSPNHEIYGCEPIFPPSLLLSMLPDYIEAQNFEACKAIEDVIREWFVEHGVEVPIGATLKIPPKNERRFHGHLSLGDPDDPSGLANGGTYNF